MNALLATFFITVIEYLEKRLQAITVGEAQWQEYEAASGLYVQSGSKEESGSEASLGSFQASPE